MSDASLETARLRLDRWSEEHTELLARLAAMPEITAFVGPRTTWPRSQAEEVSALQLQHWRQHDFGWRVAVAKNTGRPVGFIALNFIAEGTKGLATTEYELGWWIDPAAWGHGYAREGAAALRDEAFDRLGAPSVVARIQPENDRSLAVAAALGLEADFQTTGRTGETLLVYRLDARR